MSYANFAKGCKAVIVAPEGATLTPEEVALFQAKRPFGYILFARNCENPEQLHSLTQQLREVSGHKDVPILIDQEGGRVMRLKPPHWPKLPNMKLIGDLYKQDKQAGLEAVRLLAETLADQLLTYGVTVDCAPVCDVLRPETHDAIGDRAFSDDPEIVAELSRELAETMMVHGLLPVTKHIPGHGRATSDSHKDLPIVSASREVLDKVDFVPFRKLADLPLSMVAHIAYDALDKGCPSSLSKKIIQGLIRTDMAYQGFLISDDISMLAVPAYLKTDDPAVTAQAHIAAGCDVALHCNGKMGELQKLLEDAPEMSVPSLQRWQQAERCLQKFRKSYQGKNARDYRAKAVKLSQLLQL